jgi:CHASE2 domain-containing sensor protein
MTAITTHPLSTSKDALLRFAMRADATVCAAAGLLVAFMADPLSRLTGVSATLEWVSGAAFVAYGAALYMLAAARDIRRIGMGVVASSMLLAIATVVVVAGQWLPLTPFGVVTMLVIAVGSAAIGVLQYRGVRRLRA